MTEAHKEFVEKCLSHMVDLFYREYFLQILKVRKRNKLT